MTTKSKKINIILVADVRGWAFDSIARYLKDVLSNKYDLTILYSGDFKTPVALVEHIAKLPRADIVHFFYRAYLQLLFDTCKNNKIKGSVLERFFSGAISFGIPEHLFLETQHDISANYELFTYCDNYYCTSSKLQKIYNNISEYPKPHEEVIFDNVKFENIAPNFNNSKTLSIAWVGNSNWGLWYFDKNYDAKGYHTVAAPFFDLLKRKNTPHNLLIADSAQERKSKEEVFQVLQDADILIITGKTDGTPLPIIEAMACGCAIITTDNGIAMDVLPKEQRGYIVQGDPQEFYNSFVELNQDREKLTELKQANYRAFKKIFLDKGFFVEKWDKFIKETIKRSLTNQQKKKKFQQTLVDSYNHTASRSKLFFNLINNKSFRELVKILLKVPLLSNVIRYLLYKLKPLNSFRLKKKLGTIKGDYVVFYLEHFPGVRNSTLSLFENSVALEFDNIFNYIEIPQPELEKIAHIIMRSGIKRIVFSGANDNIFELMRLCSQQKSAEQQVDYVWHSSPAQWSFEHHLGQSKKLFDLVKNNVITNIATLKRGLDLTLAKFNIKSYLLQNIIQTQDKYTSNSKSHTSSIKIGLWSAYNMWIKNLYPQLLSIGLVESDVSLLTNFNYDETPCHIFEKIKAIKLPSKLPHEELIFNMSNTDITLYVTHSECSPMIALESLSLGIPCIVGPASGLYSISPYLEKMLTVNRVDCALSISERINDVIDNLDKIKAKLPEFIREYNEDAYKLKQRFLANKQDKLNDDY